jgi:hypothetical protein
MLSGFGLFLLYVFPLGVFSLVGFEFVGLTGAFDVWPNIEHLLPFALGVVASALAILMGLQSIQQLGANPFGWLAKRSWWLQLCSGVLVAAAYLVAFYFRFDLLVAIAMAIQFLLIVTFVYCAIVSQRKLLLWDSVTSILILIGLSFFLGSYSAYQKITIAAAAYDIQAEGRDFKKVKLVRSSPNGVIFWQDGAFGFVNATKITSIVRSSDR